MFINSARRFRRSLSESVWNFSSEDGSTFFVDLYLASFAVSASPMRRAYMVNEIKYFNTPF